MLYYVQMIELNSVIRELKLILYGDDDSEPSAEACAQLTVEFFREDTLRLLIIFLPRLNLEVSFQTLLSYICCSTLWHRFYWWLQARKDATQVIVSLQRQPLPSRFEASRYLETNLDLLDILISGYIYYENNNDHNHILVLLIIPFLTQLLNTTFSLKN